jgi:hypothetical protein
MVTGCHLGIVLRRYGAWDHTHDIELETGRYLCDLDPGDGCGPDVLVVRPVETRLP